MDNAAAEHWIDAIGLPALEQVRDRQPDPLTADVRRQAARGVILTVREAGAPANPDGARPAVFNLRLVASIVLAEVQVWMAYGPALVAGELRGSHQERIPVAGATIVALATQILHDQQHALQAVAAQRPRPASAAPPFAVVA